MTRTSETTYYLLIPSLAIVVLLVVLAGLSLDVWVSDLIYRAGGNDFVLRHGFVTETVIHSGGQNLVRLIGLMLIGVIIAVGRGSPYQGDLIRVFFTAACGALVVSLLKRVTGVPCPWDLQRYGGDIVQPAFLQALFGDSRFNCFPAGRASGAYCWFGLFYFVRKHFPKWRWWVLSLVIVLGLIFGIGQQLRGAHFLSHDLWSAWFCWIIAYFLRPQWETALAQYLPRFQKS